MDDDHKDEDKPLLDAADPQTLKTGDVESERTAPNVEEPPLFSLGLRREQMPCVLTEHPKRIRFDNNGWIYASATIGVFFLWTTCLLLLLADHRTFSLYHPVAAIPSIALWLFTGMSVSKKSLLDGSGNSEDISTKSFDESGISKHVSLCSNRFLWPIDMLMLMGMLSASAFCAMQVLTLVQSQFSPWDTAIIISVPVNFFSILVENFLFRNVALGFHFTKTEFKLFKGVQLSTCVFVMGGGVSQ